ncbi:tetratricopeptide repeat protein [Novosphingobium sp.]|uniref:tetratricopeptide repeat protein n=1 Tax=Novosphingobium sp. TaxID=1874826 RepID=UPI0028ABDA9D|nr:tetratricopeptide repeat protein [Novosphingobium sp.]
MISDERRLDGWKAIAAYFGRDRTTVARWARERGLPIHQLPGGKQKTVFAYRHELEEWESRNPAETPVPENHAPPESASGPSPPGTADAPLPLTFAQTPTPAPPPSRSWIPRATLAAALLAVAVLILLLVWPKPRSTALPEDPVAARDFVAARDAWAHRTPRALETSIRLYGAVIARAPDYAPARAGLAEAWLIYREYGKVSDAEAYGKARIAADKALALDPDLASAYPAKGFIDYWWDNDPTAALKAFRTALHHDGDDGLTYFWIANVLSDLGESSRAERYYLLAMERSPGSQPIAVEHAWAKWQAGHDAEALAALVDLKRTYPQDATVSSCLSWVYLGQGDIRGFAREFAEFASLREDPSTEQLSARMNRALVDDPGHAHRIMIADALGEIAEGGRRIRQTPAFYASSMKDRAVLIDLLHEAVVLGERWYSRPVTRRIEQSWKGDGEVQRLLRQLVPPAPDVDLP